MYGNGVMATEDFKKQMTNKGVTVKVHHIREEKPKELPPAAMCLLGSTGCIGKPI